MPPEIKPVKIAACHVSPVYLDPTATAKKIVALIDEAANADANLVVFPEAFLPGFPFYAATLAPVDHANHFSRYVKASVYLDGPEIGSIVAKARERGVVVSLGFSERSPFSSGCIWNSNIIINDHGKVVTHHRKLVATYYEKLVWSHGDGFGLGVAGTRTAGRVGALICGENNNPLARFSLIGQDEQIHIASFPPAWPTKREGGYNNKTANMVRGAAHSFEAKCFTVVCAGYLDRQTIKDVLGDRAAGEVIQNASQATTQFFGPDALQLGEELSDKQGIAYATVDPNVCIEAKRLHDVAGGYNRFDVFDLRINSKRLEPAQAF